MKFKKKVIIPTLIIISIVTVILFNNYYYHNNFGQQVLLHTGYQPWAISFNPNTNIIYVANSKDNTVSVIDGKTTKASPIQSRHF
ncbi:MAG: hypothetical protein ABJB76_06600 [Candidatus Nitrosocosmicus sp.]